MGEGALQQLFTTGHNLEIVEAFKRKNIWDWDYFAARSHRSLQANDNLVTHYQCAFKKGILIRQCHESNGDGLLYNLFISRDDKAYICLGTSTGEFYSKFYATSMHVLYL